MGTGLHGALIGFEAGLDGMGVPVEGGRARYQRVGREGLYAPQAGTLLLQAERGEKRLLLEVTQEVARADGGLVRTRATIEADVDPICSLRSWVMDSVFVDARGRELYETRLVEEARVRSRDIKWTGADAGAPQRTERALTTEWTWMHAVESLVRTKTAGLLQADLLEELTILRTAIRAQPAGRCDVAGQRMHVWRLTGSGLAPRHAFVHPDGALMAWVSPSMGWFRSGRSA